MTGKDLITRFDLWLNGCRVYVDGEEMNLFDNVAKKAREGYFDDKKIEVYHESYKNKKRSKFLNPTLDRQEHPKGKIGFCQYYMIGFGLWKKPAQSVSIPYHRFLYIWFYDDLNPELDIEHVNGCSVDNRLSNLNQTTHKDNLRKRKGAKNQYE